MHCTCLQVLDELWDTKEESLLDGFLLIKLHQLNRHSSALMTTRKNALQQLVDNPKLMHLSNIT